MSEKPAKRTCKLCPTDISDRAVNAIYCIPCAEKMNKQHQRAAYEKRAAERESNNESEPKERRCQRCDCDISHRSAMAKYCTGCAYDVQREGQQRWRQSVANNPERLAEIARKKARIAAMKAEPVERHCVDCGCDISERHPKALRCIPCANTHNKEMQREYKRIYYKKEKDEGTAGTREVKNKPKAENQRKPHEAAPRVCLDCGTSIDEMHHRATRCTPCKVIHKKEQAREKMRRKRKDRPGQPIRAISPVASELGHLPGGCSKERKQKPQLPPPNLAKAQYIVKIGKTTYFPRTEKRYKELLAEKVEKERALV